MRHSKRAIWAKRAKLTLIRPRDQATLAIFLGCLLVLIWGAWRWAGGDRGRLVDIDSGPSWEARYEINVNQADWPELMQLPKIGQTLAKRIVRDRTLHGPFGHLEDLNRVEGIGPHTLERIRQYLVFSEHSRE